MDFQDGGGPADAGDARTSVGREFARALHERSRVFTSVCLNCDFGWIGWSRICRIYWDFQDGGGPVWTQDLQARTSVGREITSVLASVYECWADCTEAGFAGFLGIFRMAGVPPSIMVRWYERWTELRFASDLREMGIRDFERWVGCLEQDLQDFWDFQDGGILAGAGALVRAFTSVSREIMRDCERLRAFTRDSDRSSEGTGRAAGDFSVGLPAKAGQRGYFSEFFITMSALSARRHILSSILGCSRSVLGFVDRFAQRGQAARLRLVGPRRARSFTKKTALPDAGRLSDVGWAGRSGLARHETRGPTSY